MYDRADGIELPRLKRELALVRKRGFAINDQRTETGLTAVGMLIRNPVGEPGAGLSLAMPTARFDRDMLDLAAGWSPSSASPAMNGSPNCPSGSGTDDANRSCGEVRPLYRAPAMFTPGRIATGPTAA